MTNLALLEALNDHLVDLDLSGHLVLLVVQARHLGGVELPAVDDVEWVSGRSKNSYFIRLMGMLAYPILWYYRRYKK